LRQNRTGIWSHFLMGSGVTKFDVRGELILDPEEAVFANFPADAPGSGSPEVEFDAASFVGFFEVYLT
ncbi:MAG: hypothetical protein HUJ60_01860, partial [Bacilli bacterium]|nr:hypothetical protein [Bacilli bacterium]